MQLLIQFVKPEGKLWLTPWDRTLLKQFTSLSLRRFQRPWPEVLLEVSYSSHLTGSEQGKLINVPELSYHQSTQCNTYFRIPEVLIHYIALYFGPFLSIPPLIVPVTDWIVYTHALLTHKLSRRRTVLPLSVNYTSQVTKSSFLSY